MVGYIHFFVVHMHPLYVDFGRHSTVLAATRGPNNGDAESRPNEDLPTEIYIGTDYIES